MRRSVRTAFTVAMLVTGASLGVAAGLGGYTFVYARGASYLTDDPRACANCHLMGDWYDGWQKSSHHHVAVCNDCHTPPGFFAKYLVKARNGYHHSLAFTTGDFPEPLRITDVNREVTESACRKCHESLVEPIEGRLGTQSCLRCHPTVGHLQ